MHYFCTWTISYTTTNFFMKITIKIFILFLAISAFTNSEKAYGQINNYWSMGSNTSASLLGGAVIGGGAGDIAIFYNPAAIRIEDQKQIAFNASLLNFDLHNYKNALGYDRNLEYLEWGVKPRFLSYKFRIKDKEKWNYQIAMFSREDQLIELWDYETVKVNSQVGNHEMDYTASYDLNRRYKDYWFGLGGSYIFSPNFSVGLTLFGSAKSLRYSQSSIIDLDPLLPSISDNSSWSSIEKQSLYTISLIPKLGLLYHKGQFGIGLSITLPSIRLWGDGNNKRIIRYSNVYVQGQKQDDFLKSDYNNYMVATIKEPLAVSLGLTYKSKNKRSEYYFTAEYFAPIKTYRMLDNTKISGWGQEENSPGSDFLSMKYGAKQITNIAVGYRHKINDNFFILGGMKTNFSAYDPSSDDEWKDMNKYIIAIPSLYHISSGVQFKYKANTVIIGAEFTFGEEKNAKQLSNYGYPGIFDKDKHIALQNNPEYTMEYSSSSLGFYIGYTFDF